MRKFILLIVFLLQPSLLWAGQVENISACVSKAKEYVGVSLDEFKATYEGNIFALSTVSWPKVLCEVKLGNVHNLIYDNEYIIYSGFSGADSYKLNEDLSAKTDQAVAQLHNEISNIRQRIALLEDRMSRVSDSLSKANPDHSALTDYVLDGVNRSLTGIGSHTIKEEPSITPSPLVPSSASAPLNVPQETAPFNKCIQNGVKYYKAIGSYPTLHSAPNKGRPTIDVIKERCGKTLTAFPDF